MKHISAKFKSGDKVIFKLSKHQHKIAVFDVIDVKDNWVKIEPGTYGNKDMIIEAEYLQTVTV